MKTDEELELDWFALNMEMALVAVEVKVTVNGLKAIVTLPISLRSLSP